MPSPAILSVPKSIAAVEDNGERSGSGEGEGKGKIGGNQDRFEC
jgi:hypothetical protein